MASFFPVPLDAVEVVEANREGWYDMLCVQFRTEEQDARIRLRVR